MPNEKQPLVAGDAEAVRNAALEEAAVAMLPALRNMLSRGEAAATIRALKRQPAPEVQDELQAAQAECARLRRVNFELESAARQHEAQMKRHAAAQLALHASPTAVKLTHRAREFAEWLNERRQYDVSAVFHEVLSKVCGLLAATSWLAIETAPRSGELMLLAGEMDGPGDWRIKVGGYWNGAWHIFGASWTPTRWMPLPLPPEVLAEDLVRWALTGGPSTPAPAGTPSQGSKTLQCWNCRRTMTYDQRADADGQCPYCDAEIELYPESQGEGPARDCAFHFWDFTDAKTASVATVQAKARKGWKLFRVSQGVGAAGGTAQYEHALVGPAGELLKVSTRTVGVADVFAEEGVLPLSMNVLLVPGIAKTHLTAEAGRRGLNRAEDLGARWNSERRSWMIRPDAAAGFAQWLPADAAPVHMFPSLEREANR